MNIDIKAMFKLNFLVRWMANKALQSRMDQLFHRNGKKPGLMHKLLFGRIKKHLGGNVRLMVVGSAPVDSSILTFIRATLGKRLY